MATSGSFKKTARQSRNITVEDFFDKGIYMTDSALATGLCGNLVNYRIDANTGHLKPRGGFCPKDSTRDVYTVSKVDDIDISFKEYYPIRSDLLINNQDNIHTYSSIAALDDVANEVSGVNGEILLQKTATDQLFLIDNDQGLSLKHATNNSTVGRPFPIYSIGLKDGVHIIKDMPAFEVLPEQLGCTILNTFIGLCSTGLYKYTVTEATPTDSITLERIDPMVPDVAFAVQYGYNMLSDTPYTFTNDGSGSAVEFQGLVPYKYKPQADPLFEDEDYPLTVETNYKQGEAILFQLYYKYKNSESNPIIPSAADFKFEIRIGDADEWKPITGGDVKYEPAAGALQHIGILIRIPAESFQIRVFYKENDPTQCFNIYSFSGGAEEDGATKIDTPNYDLKTAQGIFSWKRRIGLYGVKSAPNLIFLSDIDNPSYFPYPNNIIEYDSPVLKVVNFLDDIMVFTTDGIYQTELGTDGNSYITKQTVGNIHLTMSDMYSIQTIKNMLFYKAGNRYYMLVPSTKYTTLNQLQVAPISAPINYLLDNFEIEFRKILHAMYGSWENAKMEDGNISYLDTFVATDTVRCELIPTVYSSFVDGDVVKLNYGFRLNGPAIHDVHIIYTLMYDTLHKVWLSDIVELGTLEVLNMYRKSILGTSQYVLTNVTQMANEDETIENTPELTVAILQEDVNTLRDYSINSFAKHFPVRQLLDTGFRDINSAWKKRFREIQIKLTSNNKHYPLPENVLVQQTEAYKALYLNPKFKIDNDLRNDGDIYYLSRDEETSTYFLSAKEFYLVAKGDAHLEHELDIDYYPGAEQDLFFKLDEESLTDATTNIVRFKVTGKGRCPRIQLNVHTEVPYELHSVAWVFRNMNAR